MRLLPKSRFVLNQTVDSFLIKKDECGQTLKVYRGIELSAHMKNRKSGSRSRTPLAITLIAASFVSAFILASFSRSTTQYWVAATDLTVGHQISTGDLMLSDMNLGSSSANYFSKDLDLFGQVVKEPVSLGALVGEQSVSSTATALASSGVPLSIRSVDVAAGVQAGALVDIYWVLDSQNGELPEDPILILGGVTVLSSDGNSKNFGTDAALTVSVEQTQVLRLLNSTTRGRLVVICSHV